MYSSSQGDIAYLEAHRDEILRYVDTRGNTALDYALSLPNAESTHYFFSPSQRDLLRTLLNHVDLNGDYPLCFAVDKGNMHSVRHLLRSGARVQVPSNDNAKVSSVLHIALEMSDRDGTEILGLLLETLFSQGTYDLKDIYRIMNFEKFCSKHGRGHHLLAVVHCMRKTTSTHLTAAILLLEHYFTLLHERVVAALN